ncbi:MAG TPA: hypothetical protein V6D46_06215 [Coleofasciculaceae cyanobacterium]
MVVTRRGSGIWVRSGPGRSGCNGFTVNPLSIATEQRTLDVEVDWQR